MTPPREDGMSDFDGIIVGGGHNGLTRAAAPSWNETS
jgi:tRNA U34 5-carboxymethylaminomethyl modifying enzyme MnmG/GidA